jgi:hypothetical protein
MRFSVFGPKLGASSVQEQMPIPVPSPFPTHGKKGTARVLESHGLTRTAFRTNRANKAVKPTRPVACDSITFATYLEKA